MIELLGLVVSVISAFACRAIAKAKHRRSGLWFVIGLFFGLFAVIVLSCLPALPV